MDYITPSAASRGLCEAHAAWNWLYHLTRRSSQRPRDTLYNYEDSLVNTAIRGGKIALIETLVYPQINFCKVNKPPYGGDYFVSVEGNTTLLKLETCSVSTNSPTKCSFCELLACIARVEKVQTPINVGVNCWFMDDNDTDSLIIQFRYGVLREKYLYGIHLNLLGVGKRPLLVSMNPSQIDVDLLRKWTEHCQDHHASCERRLHSILHETRYFRVLDITTDCVVPAPAGCEYIALSYVWGDAVPFTLRKANITFQPGSARTFENSYAKLDRHLLPQTTQDAMFVVASIGKRYLWVDSLCIIQDDLEDLDHNIHYMDRIYSSAALTIVAAGGDSATAGLQGLYPGSRTLDLVTAWGQRAWTYQEYQFSDRSLIFTNQRVYYECRTGFAREIRPDFLGPIGPKTRYTDFEPAGSSRQDYDLGNHRSELWSWRPKLKPGPTARYERHVEEYSPRQLTHNDDILNAFTAIIEDYTKETGSKSCWGLPLHHFSEAMLWAKCYSSDAPKGTRRRVDGTTLSFPSWSWAGWVGGVDFRIHSRLRKSLRHITFVIVWPWDTEYDIANAMDPFATGILTIRVSLGVVELDDIMDNKDVSYRHFDEGRFDGERIHCLLLGIISRAIDTWDKLEHTHLVMAIEQYSDGKYCRIGLLQLRESVWRRAKPVEQVIQLS